MFDPEKEATGKEEIERLEHNLTNHPPVQDITKMKMERIRADAKNLGISILSNSPDSRERSLALTNLEQTVMWSIAAIARNQ